MVVCLTALILVATMSVGLRIVTAGPAGKRAGDDLARPAIYTRHQTLLPQVWAIPELHGRSGEAQARQPPIHAAALQRPHEQRGRLLAPDLCGPLWTTYRQPQTAPEWHSTAPRRHARGSGFRYSVSELPAHLLAELQAVRRPGATPGAAPAGTGATGTGTGAQGTDTAGTGTDSQQVPTGDTPTILGGNIIGVGSKINQASVIVYEQAKNYRLFEFIWDPSKDMAIVSSQGAPIGTPAGTPGQTPTGSQPNPMNPQPNPPLQPPNPNPPQQ